ncbi:Acyltransferase family [Popillia japonica]|uniref:Acyltransferase family n=1 Tax=Popillia japonica TaxID=7064 RepID=A0AAW1IT07_POPJA
MAVVGKTGGTSCVAAGSRFNIAVITFLLLASRTVLVGCTHQPLTSSVLKGFEHFWESFEHFWESFDEKVSPSDCKTDLLLTVDRFRSEEWAVRMWDAWAKPQTGILTGNSMHLGNYDECLSVVKAETANETAIYGQYCSIFIQPHDPRVIDILINNMHGTPVSKIDILINNMHGTPTNPSGLKSGLVNILDKFRLSWGICVPHSCSNYNIQEMWAFTNAYFELNMDIEIRDEFCETNKKQELSDFAHFTVFLLCSLLLIAGIGTMYHVYINLANKSNKKNERRNILIEFSIYANVKKVLSTKTSDPLQCLNAVRVLSLFWIITRHYFMLIFYFPHLNSMDLRAWKGEFGNMFILSGSMAVDSFFTASGISVAYLFLQSREKGESFSLFHYYAHKMIKVMPTLLLIVLIYASLLVYLGNGPFWPIIYNLFQRDCENNWWSTILFVANYVHPTNHCLTQGWYLSVDIQLFLLSPLLLLPLTRWPKPTIIATILLIAASMVQCFIESWTMNLGSTHFDENALFHTNIVATHIRAPSWLIGFIMGYFLYRFKDVPISPKRSTIITLWLASISIFLIIILGHETVAGHQYNAIRSSLFNTLVRPSWSVALCWVIFACMKGFGGLAGKVMTAPIFNIIIKINFNMFLLHVLPQIYFIGQTRMSTYFSNMHNLYLVLADLAGALLVAFVWTLIVEPWIVVMEGLLLRKTPEKEQKICTISLLNKDNSDKFNELKYVTTEILRNEVAKDERNSP